MNFDRKLKHSVWSIRVVVIGGGQLIEVLQIEAPHRFEASGLRAWTCCHWLLGQSIEVLQSQASPWLSRHTGTRLSNFTNCSQKFNPVILQPASLSGLSLPAWAWGLRDALEASGLHSWACKHGLVGMGFEANQLKSYRSKPHHDYQDSWGHGKLFSLVQACFLTAGKGSHAWACGLGLATTAL